MGRDVPVEGLCNAIIIILNPQVDCSTGSWVLGSWQLAVGGGGWAVGVEGS